MDALIAADTFQMELSRIRQQMSSKLENQKHVALVLSAVEENLTAQQQNDSITPVAYFVSFLALLEQSINVADDTITDKSLATTASYLLDLTLPHIPKPLLKSKFSEILTKLAPAITNSDSEAPIIKSSIGSLETLLLAQDLHSWNNTALKINPKRGFNGLLEFSLDPRPKVRKRALDAVNKILSNPPPGPTLEHVAGALAAEFALAHIVELVDSISNRKSRDTSNNKETNAKIIHNLKLISAITSSNSWPTGKIETLCDLLLEISKTNDQYLVSNAFDGFEGLFNSMKNDVDEDKFIKVLNVIFDLKPSINDSNLAGAWIAVIAKGVNSYSALQPMNCLKKLPSIFKILLNFFQSEVPDIYISASQCLISIITESIPDDLLLLPSSDNQITIETFETVEDVITELAEILNTLLDIKYNHATKEILEVFTTCFNKFRTRCNPEFLTALKIVGEWRTNEEFQFIPSAESMISSAIAELGPEVVLNVLPLNLVDPKGEGRAWLLPLLRDNIRFARLGYFNEYFLPLIDNFTVKMSNLKPDSIHSKIYQTIIDQIWSLLPHFMDLPSDLVDSFTDEFAANLSSLLYSKVELRVVICNGLKMLVESNLAFSKGALDDDKLLNQVFNKSQAVKNLDYLSSKSSNLLAVLFNVFSQTLPESRNFVLETIDAYLSISKPQDLTNSFNKVCSLLKDSLDKEANDTSSGGKKNNTKLSSTMMDLIVAMAKYLPEESLNSLFTIFNQTVSLQDPLLQKRSYRIISKLNESELGQQALTKYISSIEKVLIESSATVHLTARSSRLLAINTILKLLPKEDLFFIPSILSEVILSTKDVNEKTREESYKILIEMGNKMEQGGIIKNSLIPGFDESMADSEANLTEFFTMICAGLAGSAPHMISATITAISCLVYEFKDKINTELLMELSSTVELFLTSNNREIVKSTIGFVKIAAISLPEDLVRPNLKSLLENLLRWSHEHTGHFKSKVKHIIERLIRRFGFDTIEQNFPEEDKKLLTNIRKTKARAKRRAVEEEEEAAAASSASGVNARPLPKRSATSYEDVIYGSDDSDDEDDIDDEPVNKKSSQFIVESKDTPLDLLDRQALSHISSSKPKSKSNRRIDASEFEKGGKLHFSEKSGRGRDEEADPLASLTSGINAYVDAVKSGPVRGIKNQFKFKRGKKAHNDDDDGDDGADDSEQQKRNGRTDSRNKLRNPKFQKGGKISKPKNKSRKKL